MSAIELFIGVRRTEQENLSFLDLLERYSRDINSMVLEYLTKKFDGNYKINCISYEYCDVPSIVDFYYPYPGFRLCVKVNLSNNGNDRTTS